MLDAQAETRIATVAWHLRGITHSLPGRLRLNANTLSFVYDDGAVLFKARLRDVSDIVFPWYYFGGGCKLTVAGARHRFSFVRPNDAEDAIDRLAARGGDAGAVYSQVSGKIMDIGSGRAAGKVWKQVLTVPKP